MATHNLVIALALLVAVAIAVEVHPRGYIDTYAANKSHHLIIGYRVPGDKQVLKRNVVKKSSWLQIVTALETFNTSRYETITQIAAYDQKTDGTGAYPTLVSGGPGYRNATMRFKSQRSHGINFVVEIYARP